MADCFTNRVDFGQDVLHTAGLQRRKTTFDQFDSTFSMMRMRISPDAVVDFAAQQIPYRGIERLALDVIQGHVNRGHCAAAHHAGHAMSHRRQQNLLPDLLDVKRVFADEQGGDVLNRGLNHARPTAAFAHAINAFVREHFDEEPVAP